ncbi:coiled-coil domain-containing protein 103 [Hylaeus anthracinus]|uniref:coiled-coil domain-containing protein 103 n=1 Tax=Hylaeus anthracinus TaxID=313031 RepID=UPI0023B8F9B7|nr:coiled-coil domain-containing protein 103 [Hylaeus anthracinus]
MSKLTSPIDYKKLELELVEALKADELYKLQNDAKLRAVEQNVPTYEDFRQMVNAAHLKPLQRDDVESKVKTSWNPVAINKNSNTIMVLDELKDKRSDEDRSNDVLENELPVTYEQFIRSWKIIKGYEAKFNYLRHLRDTLREKVFSIEIPSTLFAELINVCLHRTVTITSDIECVVEILTVLSECNRFCLTACFMGENERATCTRLFRELLARGKDVLLKNTIKSLGLIYGIVLE